MRLGVPAFPEEAKLYSVTLRWADAIFLDEGFVNIVEAKLKPNLGVIGQLEGYKELFKVTPEFSQWKDWPIKMIILAPVLDLGIVELAGKKGIIYEQFIPPEWAKD